MLQCTRSETNQRKREGKLCRRMENQAANISSFSLLCAAHKSKSKDLFRRYMGISLNHCCHIHVCELALLLLFLLVLPLHRRYCCCCCRCCCCLLSYCWHSFVHSLWFRSFFGFLPSLHRLFYHSRSLRLPFGVLYMFAYVRPIYGLVQCYIARFEHISVRVIHIIGIHFSLCLALWSNSLAFVLWHRVRSVWGTHKHTQTQKYINLISFIACGLVYTERWSIKGF